MIDLFLSQQAWLAAGLIFVLRVIEMSIDTMRVLMVVRNKKALAWVLGFCQAFIFVVVISYVLSDLDNPLKIFGYAAGFATGTLVGMIIEERLAIGHVQINIISSHLGSAVVDALRSEGYAITEIPARGKDGMVSMINSSVLRKNLYKVRQIVNEVDPDAFITVEDVRPVRRGLWRA